jgi:uncharacterized SAM-binding protein YcdF (DUF218 family)
MGFLLKGKSKPALRLCVFSLLILLVPSLHVISDPFLGHLEQYYPTLPIQDYPRADAIVVLDGSTGLLLPPRREAEETEGSRLWPTARLFHSGKAKFIVVTGGLPYRTQHGTLRADAEDMIDVLVAYRVPRKAIISESASRNTQENAQFTAKILAERHLKKILLVTSAFHIRRATALFRKTGLEVIPVPVAHQVVARHHSIYDWLPRAEALARSTMALKEYVGYFVVKVSIYFWAQ